jgi:maltose alpha-D-glucosyltransferase/alpha-amylase
VEQSNSSLAFGDRFIMKIFRRLDEGVSPELEVGRFLTTRTSFQHMPAVVGAMEYRRANREPLTVGVVHAFVPNEGDAWRYTVDAVDRFFEHVLTAKEDLGTPAERPEPLVADQPTRCPPGVAELIGMYLGSARLLGQRTAELHVALGSRTDEPAFTPEPFTALYQRSLYQSLRTKAEQSLDLLNRRIRSLPPEVRESGDAVLAGREALLARLHVVAQRPLGGMRIRCHGDYHLGQVLYTGRDFVILDFEGEPALPLGRRRLKRSPLVDVAGMLRSFDYAAASALIDGRVRPEDVDALARWADVWRYWVSRAFLDAYRETATPSGLLPRSGNEVRLLLDCYQIEKALYELAYELNHRPTWTRIPLRGIRSLLQEGADTG